MTSSERLPEPSEVFPEERFEEALFVLLKHILDQAGRAFTVVPRFGLDIAVFFDDGQWVFIEAKSFYGQRPGGVGFGGKHGRGSQVELLLIDEARLARLDDSVRWAYVDATRPVGSAKFGLFTSVEAKQAAMGGVGRGKHNNFGVSAFSTGLAEWSAFCHRLEVFLLGLSPA